MGKYDTPMQRGLVQFNWDRYRLRKLMKKLETFGKSRNKVLIPAVRAGMAVVSREIRKSIPAYMPKRRSRSHHTTDSGRRRSRLWEAKKAVGVTSRLVRSGSNKGGVHGKAGSNVGKPKMTSVARAKTRAGFKGVGIGRGNLHWYLAGTADRRTRTGIRTGRMRRPRIVQRAASDAEARVEAAVRKRIKVGIKRLYRRSR